jgi:RHS repeat-associated protein
MLDSIVAPGHMKLSYTRDARGRPLTATDGTGRVFRFHYQPGGLQNLDTVYTPTGATALRRDAAGRTDRVTNALGQTGTVTFDAVNRPLTVTDNLQQVTALSYGAVRMDTVRDSRQQVYGFLSNVLGWDTVRVDPRGGRTVTAYRTDGRPTEVTNRRGQRISFEYDDQGRPVRQIHDRPGTALRDTISFSYDSVPAGRVVNTRDSGTTFGADTAVSMLVVRNAASADTVYHSQDGRPMRQVTGRAGGHRYTLTTTYADSVGLPRRLDWEEGGIQLQAWDYQMVGGYPGIPGLVQIPRLVGVTYASPSDPRIVGLPHPAGESRQYAPTSSFLRGITFTHPVANEKAGFLYHYDALGRVTERIRAAQDTAWLFRYDAAGRLAKYGKATVAPGTCVTNATGTACQLNADSVFTAGYTYDAVGNPNWFSDVLIETGNRLTRFGGWTMTYDADGNVTRKNNGASDYRFHWNALGQMDSMQVFNGAGARLGSVSYAYDGLGRRVRKTGPTGDVGFVYDGQQVALEVNPSTGAVTTRYAYYPGIDQPAYLVRDGKRYHYLRDHQGSITALVDSTGTPVNRYRYGPYGAPELRQEAVPQRFAYTGREFEPEYGMYYYRARYYDPMAGRFMSEDPIGLGGGINSYAYVGGDPVNRVDPSGLYACPARLSGYRLSPAEWDLIDQELNGALPTMLDATGCAWNQDGDPRAPVRRALVTHLTIQLRGAYAAATTEALRNRLAEEAQTRRDDADWLDRITMCQDKEAERTWRQLDASHAKWTSYWNDIYEREGSYSADRQTFLSGLGHALRNAGILTDYLAKAVGCGGEMIGLVGGIQGLFKKP